jgi:hypothetical protein
MTQDEIIEMARQVRFGTTLTHDGEIGHFINGSNYLEELEAFAKLVATKAEAKEREACAQVCDDIHDKHEAKDVFSSYAEAIRARGQA